MAAATEYRADQLKLVADTIANHENYNWELGLSINEIAETMNLSYHGARNYILAAEASRYIERVPRFGRQMFFRVPDASRMPRYSFNPKPKSPKITIDVAAQHFADSAGNFPFLSELPNFPLVIADLYAAAARVAGGSKVTEAELRQLKLILERIQGYSRNMVQVCQEMIDDVRLWDPHELAESLLMDPLAPMTADAANALSAALQREYGRGA